MKEPKESRPILSLLSGRFPELDAIAFRVHDPTEVAELRLLRLWIDIDTFASELGEKGIKIVHAIIDHEWLFARLEIIGVRFEGRPDDMRLAFWIEIGGGAFLENYDAR